MIEILLEGTPRGKGRPRFTTGGKTYTPHRTVQYERALAFKAIEAMREKEIFSGAVSLFVEACFSPAKSWKKTKKQEANDGELIHTSKPDLDNVLKIALDALSGIVFDDDQQVVEVIATKKYGPESYLYVRVNAVE